MLIALRDAGLSVAADARFEVTFRGHRLGHFFPDVVVDDCVLLENQGDECTSNV